MPCDQVIEIKLGQLHLGTLEAALKRLGWRVEASTGWLYFTTPTGVRAEYHADGRLVSSGASRAELEAIEKQMKPAFTREVVAASARRQGFKVEFDTRNPAIMRITTDGRTL